MTLPSYTGPIVRHPLDEITSADYNNLGAGVEQARSETAAQTAALTSQKTSVAQYHLYGGGTYGIRDPSYRQHIYSGPVDPASLGYLLNDWDEWRADASIDVVTPTPPPTDPVPPPVTGSARQAIATTAPVFPTGASYYPVDTTQTTLAVPYPTNEWFMNFFLGSGHQPVNMFPYDLKKTTTGMDICFPALNTSSSTSVLATFLQNISLQCTATTTTQKLTGFTDLGCTITWTAAGGSMSSNIVRGMAYVTMSYTGLTPLVVSQHAIVGINGTAVGATGSFSGTKFNLVLNNGQTWILYTSSSITLTLSTANTLTAGGAFTGTFRLALMPSSTDEAALDASAPVIPTGGSVDYSISGSTATETFTFTSTGTGSLLMYTLPHHQQWLPGGQTYGAQLTTLRGVMKAITGNTWTLTIPLPTIGWNNANPINSTRLAAVQAALTADKTFVPAVNDPYFGGKQLGKAARLILIADQVGDTNARDTLLANLKSVINLYLNGSLGTALRYDTVWGGIVSVAGLTNQDADFGNGRYNDHHFHYGYTVYAAAVIAKFDTTWATAYRAKINDLIRDMANPSLSGDPYFTSMRHFDWFEAHSWAAGNFEFGDNRNQESTSEAVNAWYGLYLWGLITGQTQLRDQGMFLFASECAAAQKYWQIKQADTIYPAPFKANGVVGILWSNKVDYATFFGAQPEYIHGIQMLPTTPATEVLVPDAWIAETWPSILLPLWTRTSVWRAELVAGGSGYTGANVSPTGQQYTDGLTASGGTGSGLVFNVNITGGQIIAVFIVYNQHGTGYADGQIITLNGSGGTGAQVRVYTSPEDGWKGVLLGAHAQTDAADAWTRANALTSWDDGSSKTQVLYHIATQV